MKKFGALLTFLLFSLYAPTARAGIDSTYFSLRLGKPNMTVALDSKNQPSLGAGFSFMLEAFKPFNSLPIAVGIYAQPMLGGKFGGMPVLQAGPEIYYFPFARLESSYVVDDEVAVRTNAWVPYAKFLTGFEFLNFHDDADGATFGASSLTYTIAAGVMGPIGPSMRWGADLGFTSTVGAKDQKSNPISVSGLILTANIMFYMP